jgi:transporter family-2 protein
MNLPLLLLGLAAGAGLAFQAGANTTMGRLAGGPEWGPVVNFAVGLVALLALLFLRGVRPPAAMELARAPWWAWTGGLLGAFYVTAVVVLAPRLGVATTLALAITGQALGSLLVDHFGLVGMAVRGISPARVAGAGLLIVGVMLIRKG